MSEWLSKPLGRTVCVCIMRCGSTTPKSAAVRSVQRSGRERLDLAAAALLAYPPTFGEGRFRELHSNGVLRRSSVESSSRLTPTSQGLQDVLGTAVLALRQPLAQLADYRARHAVVLEPPEHLLLAGGELNPPPDIYPPGRASASLRNPRSSVASSNWPIAGVMVPRRGHPTSPLRRSTKLIHRSAWKVNSRTLNDR
jgi:hypothetical protein